MDKSSVPPPREEKSTGELARPRRASSRVYVYTASETLQTKESRVNVNNISRWLRDHDRCCTAWYIMHAGKDRNLPDALPEVNSIILRSLLCHLEQSMLAHA